MSFEAPMTLEDSIVIQCNNLGKCYQIYEKPKDRLKQAIASRIPRLRSRTSQYYRDFWALSDVSFFVKKGETVGIIGANGSGKSTLLQLICGTLQPTTGTVSSRGKLAALLELGSGFNPEFTGRENIFLNATIHGISDSDTRDRLDAILGFADIGEHIDQPVKTYSSGMTVRLAFAIIAHIEADILVIDEALAVGDAAFTQKCMRYIRRFREQGTLLFVSHDTSSVISLCNKAVWIDKGRIISTGDAKKISQDYLQHSLQRVYEDEVVLAETAEDNKEERYHALEEDGTDLKSKIDTCYYKIFDNMSSASGFKTGEADLASIEVVNLEKPSEHILAGGERILVKVRAIANREMAKPIIGFTLNDRLGQVLFGENTLAASADNRISAVKRGQTITGSFVFCLPMLPNGEYALFASVAEGELHDNTQHHLLHDALIIKVFSSKVRWGLVGLSFDDVKLEVGQ